MDDWLALMVDFDAQHKQYRFDKVLQYLCLCEASRQLNEPIASSVESQSDPRYKVQCWMSQLVRNYYSCPIYKTTKKLRE